MFSKKTNLLFLGLSYVMLLAEITVVRKNVTMDDHSLFLFLPVVAFFLVSLLIQLKGNRNFVVLRKYSIALYLAQRPVLAVLSRYFDIKEGILCFVLGLGITFLVCFILMHINNKYVKKILMC